MECMTVNRTASRNIAAVLALIATVVLSSPAGAEPYRKKTNCGVHAIQTGTNRWGFFAGHNVDVDLAICTDGTFVYWGKNPVVTFPSKFPPEPLETVDLTVDPHIVGTDTPCKSSGAICAGVLWKFTAHQSIAHLGGQDFVFTVHVYPVGYQVCVVGGSCDSSETWAARKVR
jgi:hypothetical protein